jgi:putative SOS response-associated peptidase YedK
VCGRFVQTSSPADIEFTFRTTNPLPNVQPRYNAAPGQDLMVVRRHPETGKRSLDLLRWGLIPRWAKEARIGWNHINARAESVDTRPAFRFAYRKRRCLVPADAFYE